MSYMILTWFVAIDHCLASARDPHIRWAQLPAPSSYAAAPSHHGIHQTRFVHERRYIAWQTVRAVAWQTVRAVAHFDLSFGVRFILHILRPKSTDPGVRTHRTNQHSCMKLLCTL